MSLGKGGAPLPVGGAEGDLRPLHQGEKAVKTAAAQTQFSHVAAGILRQGGQIRHLRQQEIQQRTALGGKAVAVVDEGQIPPVFHRFAPLHPRGEAA